MSPMIINILKKNSRCWKPLIKLTHSISKGRLVINCRKITGLCLAPICSSVINIYAYEQIHVIQEVIDYFTSSPYILLHKIFHLYFTNAETELLLMGLLKIEKHKLGMNYSLLLFLCVRSKDFLRQNMAKFPVLWLVNITWNP